MKNYSVLLVDDEEIILATIDRDLRSEGFEVTTSSDGESAIKRMRSTEYDIIITDLMMEGIGGLEVVT